MKVLVTGATGFLGRHVIPQLLLRGHTVIAVARDHNKASSFNWYDQVDFISCNIYHLTGDIFNFFGLPDAILHLAWDGLPNYNELFHFERNLFEDYKFIRVLIEGGARHFLITGTCFEYGMRNGCLSEDMLPLPNNPYALAKDTLRKIITIISKKENVTLQWARLFYMYGDGQNRNSLISQLDRAIDCGDPVFNMSGGEQLRDYLHVTDAASKLVNLLENTQFSGIINVCSGVPISVRRLVEQHISKRRANIQLNIGHYPYPNYEPMAFWGDTKKFSSIFGVK